MIKVPSHYPLSTLYSHIMSLSHFMGIRLSFFLTQVLLSLIHSALCTRCCSNVSLERSFLVHQLVGVTGNPLTARGAATLSLVIGKDTFHTPVPIVDDLTEDGIIGIDFLQTEHCTLNFQAQSLHFPDQHLRLTSSLRHALWLLSMLFLRRQRLFLHKWKLKCL